MTPEPETDQPRPAGLLGRARTAIAYLKANRKRLFWLWIGYQSVKGLVTLSFIWIPLILIWWRGQSGG